MKPSMKIKVAKIMDDWKNVLTSIGVKGKDKRLSAEVFWTRGRREDFEHFYSADDIAGKIVDIVPEEAMTKGYKLTGIEDKNLMMKIEDRIKKLKVNEKFLEAWKLSRIHGGAGIIKVTQDAKLINPMPPAKPLLSLNVVDRWDLVVNGTDIDGELTSTTFREPLQYNLQLSEGSKSIYEPINATRVVRFDGAYLPKRLRENNGYWGDSILTKLRNPIRNYQISHDAAAVTVQDFDVPVIKIQNLAELMANNCDDKVIKRLELINTAKSVAKMIVLDAEKEDFEHKSRNVTGMKDVLDKIESRLVTSTGMPRTKLFGESSGGLGSTGESQASNWYDYIESQQENYLKPKLLEVIRYIIQSEFPKIDATKVDIEFNPLWQMSEKEEVDLRKTVADTDIAYINAGVVDPNEVGKSRFGGDKYSKETVIDMTLREGDVDLEQTTRITEEIKQEETKKAELVAEKEMLQDKVKKDSEKLTELEQSIQDLRNKIKSDLESKGVVYSFDKSLKFDTEETILAATGEPLNLKGYKFKGKFQKEDQLLGKFKITKNDDQGLINLSITPDDLKHLPEEFNVLIEMTNPKGVTKVIKNVKARLNV